MHVAFLDLILNRHKFLTTTFILVLHGTNSDYHHTPDYISKNDQYFLWLI